ncbi:hypothetical protein F511_46733 [Dorcoceras hygrometricum]|uniref:Uncharacterized protein n=1 Tax=Dorcoceras hygrometricum TaxID=472368 RepID=A0A2Z6ZST9_9LAMI|nr:hypothetical protein F511_46733 [Dorcoceras hygrometricum]
MVSHAWRRLLVAGRTNCDARWRAIAPRLVAAVRNFRDGAAAGRRRSGDVVTAGLNSSRV